MGRYCFSTEKPHSAWNRNFYGTTVGNAYNLRHWSVPRYTSLYPAPYSYYRGYDYKPRLPEKNRCPRIFKDCNINVRLTLSPQKDSLGEESETNTGGETKRRSRSNTEENAVHFSLVINPSRDMKKIEDLGCVTSQKRIGISNHCAVSKTEMKHKNTDDSTKSSKHISLVTRPSTVLRVLEALGSDKAKVNCTGFQVDETKGKKPEESGYVGYESKKTKQDGGKRVESIYCSTKAEKNDNKSSKQSPVVIKYCPDHKQIVNQKRGTTIKQFNRKKSPQGKNKGKNHVPANKSKKKLIVHEYSEKKRKSGKGNMKKKIKISIKNTTPEAQETKSKRSGIRTKSCTVRYRSTNTRLQKHKLRGHSRRMSVKGRNANSLFPPISTQSMCYFLDQFDQTMKQGLKQIY